MCIYIYIMYKHPEVDSSRAIWEICYGSFKDHILSTPGRLYLEPEGSLEAEARQGATRAG